MTAEAVRVAPDRPAALRPTVVVVDDHSLVADTVALALRGRGIAVTAAEPAAFIERIDEDAPPGGLVLLDLDLGAGRDGVELVPPLRRAGWRVLMFTAHPQPDPARPRGGRRCGRLGVQVLAVRRPGAGRGPGGRRSAAAQRGRAHPAARGGPDGGRGRAAGARALAAAHPPGARGGQPDRRRPPAGD